MFASRTICVACRSRLLSHIAKPVTVGSSNCHRQLLSTTSTPSSSTPASTTEPSHGDSEQGSFLQRDRIPSPRSKKSKHIRPPRVPSQHEKAARSRALDLFESTINAAQQADVESKIDIDALLHHANRIEEALRRKSSERITQAQTAEECYTIIVEGILPVLESVDGAHLPFAVQAATKKAMTRIIDVKFRLGGENLPKAAALCKVLTGLRFKQPGQLDPYIALLERLVDNAVDPASNDPDNTVPFDSSLLDDLLDCWNDIAPSERDVHAAAPPEPSGEGRSRIHIGARQNPCRKLREDFPLLAAQNGPKLVVALVGTHAVLLDPRSEPLFQRPNFEVLQATLKRLIDKVDLAQVEPYFSGFPSLWKYVLPLVQRSKLDAPREKAPTESSKAPERREGTTGNHVSYRAWHNKFSALFKFNDYRGVSAAWTELTEPIDDPDRAAKLRQCPELFDFIIFQCCSKFAQSQNQAQQLTEQTMGYMNRIGLKPTIRTFTAMIEGWKLAKRLGRIEALWKHVANSGVKLDQNIWSSRISALSTLGQPNDGIKALEEMNQLWEREAAGGSHVGRAVKPSIVSVNAAISGLIRTGRHDTVRIVLAWASDKKIEPDVYTYNTLLSSMLKKGMTDEADKILTTMRAQGVNPDGATFTIILDTALAEMRDQTPAQQRATLSRVFDEMHACGITPNQETYAKMLHVLTRDAPKSPDPDDDRVGMAVEAVLAHHRGAGAQLSPEMCTILFEFYFTRRSSRDWDAIRRLIADRRSRTRVLTDRKFWETVMRRFHDAGDTAAALEIFYDMNNWGIWTSLPVLEPILRALVSKRDFDEAQKLVATVRAQTRPTPEETEHRYWKHAFWAVAKENGLLQKV